MVVRQYRWLLRTDAAPHAGNLDRPRLRTWRPGPVQLQAVNRVRAGRQQLSADPAVCRRSPGRHLRGRGTAWRDARADESARLESVCGVTHRGFESHSLRRVFARLRALASLAVSAECRLVAGASIADLPGPTRSHSLRGVFARLRAL